jgi:hypothetical protein
LRLRFGFFSTRIFIKPSHFFGSPRAWAEFPITSENLIVKTQLGKPTVLAGWLQVGNLTSNQVSRENL